MVVEEGAEARARLALLDPAYVPAPSFSLYAGMRAVSSQQACAYRCQHVGAEWRRNVYTDITAMIYVLWNNAYPQPPVAYWLKSFNDKVNPPRPGTTFSVQQINQCQYQHQYRITSLCLFSTCSLRTAPLALEDLNVRR